MNERSLAITAVILVALTECRRITPELAAGQDEAERAFGDWTLGRCSGVALLFVTGLDVRIALAAITVAALVTVNVVEFRALRNAKPARGAVHRRRRHASAGSDAKQPSAVAPAPQTAPAPDTAEAVLSKLQLHSNVPIRAPTPLDYEAIAQAEWVRKQNVLVCLNPMSGEKKETSLESLCMLWQETLATWATYDELEVLPKHTYPCIPKVHSGLQTKTETTTCRHRFLKGALNLLVLHGLVEEDTRHGSETYRPDVAFGDNRYSEVREDTSYSIYRWTKLGRAMANRVMAPTTP